jgi:hypothetical protein
MSDEDYPAYLKKQSYDDLVSISHSVDKEARADLYKMVLAEMELREKRGEKLERQETVSKWRTPATLLLGGILICESIVGLILSRPVWRVITDFVLGVSCLLAAWFSRKKGNDEKPAA